MQGSIPDIIATPVMYLELFSLIFDCQYHEAVQGSIPDMTATTAMYLELQRLYRERADRDVAAVQVKILSFYW